MIGLYLVGFMIMVGLDMSEALKDKTEDLPHFLVWAFSWIGVGLYLGDVLHNLESKKETR